MDFLTLSLLAGGAYLLSKKNKPTNPGPTIDTPADEKPAEGDVSLERPNRSGGAPTPSNNKKKAAAKVKARKARRKTVARRKQVRASVAKKKV